MVNLTNGVVANGSSTMPDIDPSKLKITQSTALKTIPPPETLLFGQTTTDHMLIIEYAPESGWSDPEIKPYAPLQLDPSSSIFHYTPAVFEGMKAFRGPDGRPRLFRPDLNMDRMERSADRVALPPFNKHALLKLIQKLVSIDSRWIPELKGYSLYIRPTYIGTRPAIGVTASTHGMIFVILSPTGPYFPTGFKPVTLEAVYNSVRSWPGGTGEFKLGINYAPCFKPQREAAKKGYQQVLWLLGEDRKITEVGQMNFFVVVKREDGDLDLITPELDGTILPGVTRDSILALAASHTSGSAPLAGKLPKIYPHERSLTMGNLIDHHRSGTLVEAFGAGTAAIICPIKLIGYDGEDFHLPEFEGGLGPVSRPMWERIVDIQEGKYESEWSVLCAD